MATKAEIEAKLERQRLELKALRDKAAALPDGPERDAIQAQRDALRAEQKTTTRELEVATSQSPATGEFEGIDKNSGEYRYKNPETGTSFLSNTAPTTAQQQTSGITVPPAPAPALATETRPETAPAEVQTPAVAPPLVDTVSPADVPAAQSPYALQVALQNQQIQQANNVAVEAPADVPAAQSPYASQVALQNQQIQQANIVPVESPAPQQIETFNEGQSTITTVTEAPAPAPTYYETGGTGGTQGTITRQSAEPVDAQEASLPTGGNESTVNIGTDENRGGNLEKATLDKAQQQAAIQARFKQPANGDWRVRIRIAPNSKYLYRAENPGILAPLAASDGVIFPYTPSIQTSYNANYDVTDLVHSNYRGQFYKNSNVGDISITGTFTAQDTAEAEYLLAVIHFFRSVTKMFYGQDSQRGAPPPLVYLFGLGQYQFNNHPCVVKTFTYNLPADVDYIRTQPNNYGVNLLNRRTKTQNAPANTIGSVIGRLGHAVDLLGNFLKPGALPGIGRNPAGQPGVVQQAVSNTSNATYVPTKIEIQLSLMPIQTRNQVSQQFSLDGFAKGDLLRGGFW